MYAVVRIAGFQFMANEGDVLEVPKLDAEPGSTVKLEDVLLVRTEDDVQIGKPTVPESWVEAEVLGHDRARKVTVFKFRRREKYRRKAGHRQGLTRLRVSGIHPGS